MMKKSLILCAVLSSTGSLCAGEPKIVDPKFSQEIGAVWNPYQFGEAGDLDKIEKTGDGLLVTVVGGGGGHGVYQDLAMGVAEGKVLRFSAKGVVQEGAVFEEGMGVGVHLEFLAGEEVIGRTDSLQLSINIGPDQEVGEPFELTASFSIGDAAVSGSLRDSLAVVNTVRLVVVAIQSESGVVAKDYGSVLIREVSLEELGAEDAN